MSKKTRRGKRRAPLKDDVTQITKPKAEPKPIIFQDEPIGVLKPGEFVMSDEATVATGISLNAQMETVLFTAPRLPWKIDTTYIDKDFRKAYVAMLKNLVELYDLPYYVNQEAILTRKE